MRKFIKTGLCFLIFLVAMLFVGENLVRQVPNPYKFKYNWIIQKGKKVETLVLGNSHTFYGIRTRYFKTKSFNLANVSQDLRYDYYSLSSFSYPRLKTVILPISYPSLFQNPLEEDLEWYRCSFYKIYMKCPYHSWLSRYNFELSCLSIFQAKLTKYFQKEKDCGCDVDGWGTLFTLKNKNHKTWNTSDATMAISRHSFNNPDFEKYNIDYFNRIANYCYLHKIKLILITTPTWKAYYLHLHKQQLNKMYSLIHHVCRKYHFSYYNYLKDNRFTENDFYDSDHLSDIGAIKFSKIIRQDLHL